MRISSCVIAILLSVRSPARGRRFFVEPWTGLVGVSRFLLRIMGISAIDTRNGRLATIHSNGRPAIKGFLTIPLIMGLPSHPF